ncbi:uncharacterized protein LOC112552927 [Pogonomyrmex barbatus]|uniref:Uncharacterized protein LOC112552927 n=1 Tax=Pogonomyrmex barbatus TaxID=144034 RepID=A0A8N1S8W5_9HYME|nr:uncharacterized protein LOC112552927 [Pogonomyrmex barbatus]
MNAEHYKINQLFMSWIGQWPEQSALKRIFLSCHVFLIVCSQYCLLILGLVAAWQDWSLVIECSSPIIIHSLCIIKFANYFFNARKVRE